MTKPDYFTTQWYWAARSEPVGVPAGKRFVVARGQEALFARVQREVGGNEHCAWNSIAPKHERETLEHCVAVFLSVTGFYGVQHGRALMEMAQVPVFARFLDRCEVSMFMPDQEGFDQLDRRIAATLGRARETAE
jgi:hypothetical protein